MGWFQTIKNPKIKSTKKTANVIPEGIWQKCVGCGELLQSTKLVENNQVCPHCQHHYRLDSLERIKLLTDENSFVPISQKFTSTDPLGFNDKKSYGERLKELQKLFALDDSVRVGLAKLDSTPFALAVMEFKFLGGSMGTATGEKIAMSMELAIEHNCPCVIVSSSGGARMQEGILSLMQLAKTSATRQKMREKGIPYLSLLLDPTTGGCAASFAMQGDIHLAEPNALIGFAGPRVIEQSIRQKLPEGFQRSEFLLKQGMIDRVVHRKDLRRELSFFLKFLTQK
ncbi:MAG: acetyl-CoA carboxylase, carboxyltransferase subunit beta [Bacteriovoracaceae bacterium]|nr:acetyl-CoA carboxylase, carboxyltransferase subunit beta [Bacteriovoracaceae bacterium]